ncbi:MAG TPA: LL-diaminopimelate aminotransferase [Gallicola sp.]|nr:LL-diaminopimelate aminotransferase [Gallicola sp.]
MKLNSRLNELARDDIFLKVTNKVAEYKKNNPDKKVISLGIGDVSKPIIQPVISAMHRAVDDLSDMKTFKGYGSYYGYDFLKDAILKNDYKGFSFSKDEIYISNGTKTDTTSILELFDIDSKICLTDPMYPIYKDGATCLNRRIVEIKLKEENDFVPEIPKEKYDIVYMCSPSNPIGIAYNRLELQKWIDYALANEAIILFDNVYSSFIQSSDVPTSIYELPNAKKVAIEFRSFSKNASFTGVRCSYYIIPNEISKNINRIWKERTINRFNGADYIAQRGAEAVYLPESQKLIQTNIEDYLDNASFLRRELLNLGFKVWGGIDSPFMWVKTTENMDSWNFFNLMLNDLNIVVIPGCIFEGNNSKYFRVSALGFRKDIEECVERLKAYYEKK